MPRTLALLIALAAAPVAAAQKVSSTAHAPFPNFESGVTHPLALAGEGTTLLALNTPDGRLEVYDAPQLAFKGSVFTGLEPVSIALDPAQGGVAFVANLLSDSVAVVNLTDLRVVATIDVGDAPQDVVVANGFLFAACARAPAPFGPSGAFVDDVLVVAATTPPYSVLARIPVGGARPRALAVAGSRVHAIPENSGNRTTILSEREAFHLGIDPLDSVYVTPNGTPIALDLPAGFASNPAFAAWPPPSSGRVLTDTERNAMVVHLPSSATSGPLDLPDSDVFALDAFSGLLVPQTTTGVGTTLLSIATNPATGKLWIGCTDAKNRRRFEFALRGSAHENDVVIAEPSGGQVLQRLHLRPPLTATAHSQPVAIAFHAPAPATAYIAALGTATVVALDAAAATLVQEIATGELPSGLAVDPIQHLLYVLCRGDQTIRKHAIGPGHPELARVALRYLPEPPLLARGRRHLYDARAATGHGNGTMACASCHVFGHADQLAWDFGRPTGGLGYAYPDALVPALNPPEPAVALTQPLVHPLGGPLRTPSLRGLADEKALSARGERRFFQDVRGQFQSLLGGSGIDAAAMQEFAAFARSIRPPPNPIQPLNRVYTGLAEIGRQRFGLAPGVPPKPFDAQGSTCVDCHAADFAGGNHSGTAGTVALAGAPQFFAVPDLRQLIDSNQAALTGFGAGREGAARSVRAYLDGLDTADAPLFPNFDAGDRDAVAAFLDAWDSGLAPLVGRQFTATASTLAGVAAFLDLAEAEAALVPPNVDLIVRGSALAGGSQQPLGGWFRFDSTLGAYAYAMDDAPGSFLARSSLLGLIQSASASLTFTAVPPGLGERLGVDRDEDGLGDRHEKALGTLAHDPDTDGDGYADGLEVLAFAANPLVPDAFLPDLTAPVILAHGAQDAHLATATLHVETDEPTAVFVQAGTAPLGPFEYPQVADTELRRSHDLVLAGLEPARTVYYRIEALDRNGAGAVAFGSFATVARRLHVDRVRLSKWKSPAAPGTGLLATVRILDQDGSAVTGVPVAASFTGPIGTAPPVQFRLTRHDGVATFVVPKYVPAAPGAVTVTPLFAGSLVPGHPFYVGNAGGSGSWSCFYDATAAAETYATVDVAP